MKIEKLSIRARVGYGVLCLEAILNQKQNELNDINIILDELWKYTSQNCGAWHYKMSEYTPFSIYYDAEFESKGFDFLDKNTHDKLYHLYSKLDSDVLVIINLIFEIGTKDLYSSICNNSPETIEFLERIKNILLANKIELPDINILSTYTIDENHGWGRAFKREDLFE